MIVKKINYLKFVNIKSPYILIPCLSMNLDNYQKWTLVLHWIILSVDCAKPNVIGHSNQGIGWTKRLLI